MPFVLCKDVGGTIGGKMYYRQKTGFALPVVLGVCALIFGLVVVSACLVRQTLAAPQRALASARAQAWYALDVALAQLQDVAADDTAATAEASLTGSVANPYWCGVWKKSSNSPIWLTSGGMPTSKYSVSLKNNTVSVPSVATSWGRYAYAVEDVACSVVKNLPDPLLEIPAGFSVDINRLRQLSVFAPFGLSNVSTSRQAAESWGLLTNPDDGGLKVDLDTSEEVDDVLVGVGHWRRDEDYICGRPIVYSEAALLCGVYRAADDSALLGLAFWADAWNPYAGILPFNPKGMADLRLRVQGPAGVANFYNASGSLLGSMAVDLTQHTKDNPLGVDLYGSMAAGEVRFITHYRLLPLATQTFPDAVSVEVSFPAGEWSYVFETQAGTHIQTIKEVPSLGFSQRWGFNHMSVSAFSASTAQWIWNFRLREPLSAQAQALCDPRAPEVPFDDLFENDPNPIHAQTNFSLFSNGDAFKDGAYWVKYDLPQGPLVSVGNLWQMPGLTQGALVLGSAAAGQGNQVFDKYFFSSLPALDEYWNPQMHGRLPNGNLVVSSPPSLATLRLSPATYLMVRGAFNINSTDVASWVSHLPASYAPFPFRTDLSNQPVSVSSAERRAWAEAIVSALKARGRPFGSLQEFMNTGILPAQIAGLSSALLQPRSDTFAVWVWGCSLDGAVVQRGRAVVQRRVSVVNTTQRYFQILSFDWID